MHKYNTFIKKVSSLESHLPKSMISDQYPIGRKIKQIKRQLSNRESLIKIEKTIQQLEKRLIESVELRKKRSISRPICADIQNLPITSRKTEIIKAISDHQVVIISGETGSGKTTQIPKYCLAAGQGTGGLIGCTQPRRIAAMMVAHRIATELGEEIGRSVGYKIRFKEKTGSNQYIKIMTDGILLVEAQSDAWLNEYDTIIVDEAHERSLNIDFVLGILKRLLSKRKNLKLVITSATIDTKKFSKAFNNAPIIEVSGRMYPVEIRYQVNESIIPKKINKEHEEASHIEMAVKAVEKLTIESAAGDILVFMPTEQDIIETCELIKGRLDKKATILPMFARLAEKQQSKVFKKSRFRKVIVSTNVAETSITIPGIKYVIDTGLARILQYNARSRTASLPVVPISKSSADQRMGRCGRIENGVCIRLFSKKDYESRPLYSVPEILRSSLAEVILRMMALGLGEISEFPFIDGPTNKNIKDGYELLIELGAIRKKKKKDTSTRIYQLTKNGRLMAKIPVDPRLSRMLIESKNNKCLRDIIVIASVLSIQDPRERPAEKAVEADEAQSAFNDASSDFLIYLNIWEKYHEAKKKLKSANQLKKFCRKYFLSYRRMREWCDIHSQIKQILREQGFNMRHKPSSIDPNARFERIHKSILCGFLSNIAVKKDKFIYKAAKGREVMIFPGSSLFNNAGSWIIASEMVETSRLFARTVANIDSNWLEAIGKDLCKYTYLAPYWEKNREEVVATEQVSLFGLMIIPGRPVSYGRVNPQESSDIFIQSCLIENDVKQMLPFMKHNKSLIDNIKDMEDRIRRRDILANEDDMRRFYEEKLDAVYDIRSLKKLIKKKGNDSFLRMKRDDLLIYKPDEKMLSKYPDQLNLGTNAFECLYNFDPGNTSDGVTVKIPLNAVSTVPTEDTDWLVPGLFQEKITALIKTLPKEYRKKLVPVSKTANIIEKEMPKHKQSLRSMLSEFIYQRFGVNIPASAWQEESLPEYLKMRFSIIDQSGKELRSGREKNILLQEESSEGVTVEVGKAKKKWEKKGITKWNFGDLPESITIQTKDDTNWVLYPGLEVEKISNKSLNLKLFNNRKRAIELHKQGVAKLYSIYFSKDLKFLKKGLNIPENITHSTGHFGGVKKLQSRLYECVTHKLFFKNIRLEKEYHAHADKIAPQIIKKGRDLMDMVIPVIKTFGQTISAIEGFEKRALNNSNIMQFLDDLKNDLGRLVPENFMELYAPDRINHIIRYLKAAEIRTQRAFVDYEKDVVKSKELAKYSESLNNLLNEINSSTSDNKREAIEAYFWMIEEYKVSIFAQELKTAIPISKKRLDKKLDEIRRMA